MKFLALWSLAVAVTGYGQPLALGPMPPLRPSSRLIPLVFAVRHSWGVLIDDYAGAVDGLHFPGLQVVDAVTPEAYGTGVIISASGYVVTAAHVVANANRIQVVTPMGARLATCVAFDPVNDVAVLKIPAGRHAVIPVRPSATVRAGEPVFMIGIRSRGAWGYTQRVAQGTVHGHPYDPRYWQANVPAEHGHSGGPLLDAQGRLIGLIQAKYELDHLGESPERPTEIATVAMKSAYILPLLPGELQSSVPPRSPSRSSTLPISHPSTFPIPAVTAAEPAVVPVVTYGTTAPLMSLWDESWRH